MAARAGESAGGVAEESANTGGAHTAKAIATRRPQHKEWFTEDLPGGQRDLPGHVPHEKRRGPSIPRGTLCGQLLNNGKRLLGIGVARNPADRRNDLAIRRDDKSRTFR